VGLRPKKSPKNGTFWYKFSPKGYIPLSHFYKILSGEGAPRPHPHAKFHRCSFKNVAVRLQKSLKMVIFGKKFAPREKFLGSVGKLEHRCTTTNLPLCNGTIIVLKLKLLHSVSVITNFVIPKRDKKQTDKKTSHFFVYSRRATTIPTILRTVIEEVRPIFAPHNFF